MKRTYVPCNGKRLALVTIFCGLDKDGEPDIELDEEPIALWRVDEDGEQITINPMVAGYTDLSCSTVRIAIDTYDGRVVCNGMEFENRDHYLANCKDFWKALSQEYVVSFDTK
jgi:hypothetical protein